MRLGLAARLALVFAGLVAVTALVTTVAGVITTRVKVNDDIDRFLISRADEITTGARPSPPGRGSGPSGEPGNLADQNQTVDADAEVQVLDANGAVESTVGIALPVSEAEIEIAGERHAAGASLQPLYDPKGERIRS